jgi:sirohydrochlorin cobaltochelatase
VTLKHTDETLLLVAHGSSRPGSDNPVALQVRHLKAQGLFDDVRCGFLKQAPLLADVLNEIQTAKLTVVPMLSGHGYITDTLIPAALKELEGTHNVRLCEPLGGHSGIADIMAERAGSIITAHNLDPTDVSILVAAHGNASNPENARQSKALAGRIETLCNGISTHAVFIEEKPLISNWPTMTSAANLIVLPFLIGGGLHGAEDVPEMLGLDASDPAFDRLSRDTPFIGPLSAHNRSIWCCRALGFEPTISDLILDLVD